MAYTTTTTSITSATSSRSKQATTYQYPSGNGVVITGSGVNSNTTAYLDVTTPGSARSTSQVSGGGYTITGITYLDSNNVVTNANAVSTTGGNIKISGTGFTSPSRVYVNNSLVTNVVSNSTAIIATVPSAAVGNVTLAVYNSSNVGALSGNSVYYSGAPSWVSSGAVSSYNDVASNIALQVSGDGTLTYTLQSGSGTLPNGISLLSSGYLTGTATGYTSDSVVTFTLVVTDPEGQAAQQNYSYTVFIGDTYFKQTSLLLSADTANTFISDSSTNNFLVSRFGDTKPSRFSPYWPGGWSAYFDGTGDYLSIASPGAKLTTGPFTIEGWIYLTSGGAYRQFIENAYWQAGSNGGYRVTITSSDKVEFSASAGTYNSFPIVLTSNSTVTTNAWNHIAVVRNTSNVITFYINGLSSNSVSYSSSLNLSYGGESQSTRIGGQIADATLYFPWIGWINSVRVVNGSAIYTANFTPNISSITTVANTSLLTLRDSILADGSPNNFTITRNGDTKLTTFSPFNTTPYTFTANSNSVYFDGTGDYLSLPSNSSLAMETNNFTIEFWFYTSNVAQSGYILNTNPGTPATSLYVSFASSTLRLTDELTLYAATPTLLNNSWYHIAIVRSGTGTNQTVIYTNGVAGTAGTCSRSFTQNSPTIGSNSFIGYISNLRILKGTALYTANFTPSTTALTSVANTSLLTCQSTTVIDNSSNNFAITVNGNPNVSIVNPFGENVSTISNYTWSANSYSASAYFDGTGDYLTAPSNSAFNFGSGNLTVECWFYRTVSGTADTLLQYGDASVTNYNNISWALYITSTNYSSFEMSNGVSSTYLTLTSNILFPLNQWVHLSVVRSGNNFTLYQNGVSVATGTTAQAFYISSNPLFWIGRNHNAGTGDTAGYISNVRILKGTALYTGPFVPPTAPLTAVANTSILTLQTDIGSNSVQFVDQSAQNNLITRNGNASQGAYSPLVPSTWSAYFDGNGDYLSVPYNSAFNLSGDFTVELWMYPTNLPTTTGSAPQSFERLFSFGNYDALNSIGLEINSNDTSRVRAFVIWYNGGAYTVSVNNAVTTNIWYHVAVVRSGTTISTYLNGVSTGTTITGASAAINTNQSLYIACLQGFESDTSACFAGYISNFRILKGTALYTANFTPATTTISPIANTSLLTLREPILADNSGNNFTITRNGDTKIVPFGPFSPQTVTPDSYSYRFSNASDYISTTNSNLALGTNDWTIESWVYPRFTANSGIFQISNVQYGLTNSNLNTVALGFSSGNKAIVRVANATYTSTGTTITANAWTHLALVKSSNVSKLYINGTLDSTLGTSGNITDTVNYTGTTNIAVGGYGSTSALANAYISNFRVVSNSAVYTSNFTVNVGPISAISGTTLLTCQANTIIDSSSANLTITANANVTPSKFNPFDETVTVGQSYSGASAGGSAYFDGSGDYLSIPYNISLLPAGDFTMEFWIYMNSLPASYYRILTSGTNNGTQNWGVSVTSTGAVNLYTAVNTTLYISTTTIGPRQWNHIAITRSGSTLRIFTNGIPNSFTNSVSLNNGVAVALTIGSDLPGTDGLFAGYISNLSILNGTAVYTKPFIPPTTPALPTTANTSLLLNFTNSGVVDATGRNVLETVNDARVVTSTYKYGSGSYYFDGTGDYLIMPDVLTGQFGTGDFTIEYWDYHGSQSTNYAPQLGTLSVQNVPSGTWRFGTHTNIGGVYFDYHNGTSYIDVQFGTTLYNDSTWRHFALTRENGTVKAFVNGVQVGSNQTITQNFNSSNRVIIGAELQNPTYFNGYLDDIRITKGYARYTANFTAPTAPFVTK